MWYIFDDLEFKSNLKSVPLCPIKWQLLKFFTKLHESCLLIYNIIKAFFLEKGAAEKTQFFIYLKGRDFVMSGGIYMNVGVFWETSMGFLKSAVLQFFPKYSQSNVNLNVKNRAKFNCL